MKTAGTRRRPGRPKSAEGPKKLIALRLKPPLVLALDKWAFKNGRTRTEAIELMIQAGLKKF